MRADELDRLSLGEFALLRAAWVDEQRRQDYRAAVLAVSLRGGHPADYFPSLEFLRPEPPGPAELERKLLGFAERGKA